MYPILTLKPGREIPLKNRHHAVYSQAISTDIRDIPTGSIVEVRSHTQEFLCYATLNSRAYIALRAISFEQGDPLEGMKRTMKRAIDMREQLVAQEDTTAYRLINAEGDALPGLIVDRYGNTLVIQLTTLGMDRLLAWVSDTLAELTGLNSIFEKSTSATRKKEGLEPREGWVRGKTEPNIDIRERGLTYKISLEGSQKTGLFLDQRDMRSLVKSFAAGRTVLDICSYVGGFSMNALAGGAVSADAVDYDADALLRAKENMQLNNINTNQFETYSEDAFDFLRRKPLPKQYDFIILDPPAFAKRSSDLDQAKGAYTDLNRMAMQALPPGGLLLTCSCSYQMSPDLFQTAVFHAARQADRNVQIIGRHRQAVDHPVNLYYPEGDYLKSLLLWVS
jgi:23S rRNA (cytosine1962-C5)-methyltransferase